MLQVKLFARAKQIVGQATISIPWTVGKSVRDLKETLCQLHPGLRPFAPQLLVAVNNEYASDDAIVNVSDEVACFPPVSGG